MTALCPGCGADDPRACLCGSDDEITAVETPRARTGEFARMPPVTADVLAEIQIRIASEAAPAVPRHSNRIEDTMEPKPQIPTIGRIVHYHFTNGRGARVTRPAIVVQAWSAEPDAALNLQVFLDGANDAAPGEKGHDLLWATSARAEQNRVAHADPVTETWWSWPGRA